MTTGQRCGFVAVLGAPNAGKSTLVNQLVGTKISIVSPKVQTTRAIVRGIALKDESQIILIDTPGLFTPKKRLERAMVSAVWEGREEADFILLLVDASQKKAAATAQSLLEDLKRQDNELPVILVFNKVDMIRPEILLPLSQQLNDVFPFQATFMISAVKNKGVDDLLNYLAQAVPEGPWLYPEDEVTTMPSRLLAAEITREKLFLALYQELPYGLTVETEKWETFDNGSIKIAQVIYVERESHKAILLGKGGQQIKKTGETARKELAEIFECPVHLNLFVKVQENWTNDPERYEAMGLNPSS